MVCESQRRPIGSAPLNMLIANTAMVTSAVEAQNHRRILAKIPRIMWALSLLSLDFTWIGIEVTGAANIANALDTGGGSPKFFAEVADVVVDAAVEHADRAAQSFLGDFFAGDDLPGGARE